MAVKPYRHWDVAANAHLYVRPGGAPLIVDEHSPVEDFGLMVSKACRVDMFADRFVDYVQMADGERGTPPLDGLRVRSFQFMPTDMEFYGAHPTGQPLPLSAMDATPLPWASTDAYLTVGYRLPLRGYVGSVNSGYAADLKVTWGDVVTRDMDAAWGGYTGLLLRNVFLLPGGTPETHHALAALHGKRGFDVDWSYHPCLWHILGATAGALVAQNGLSSDIVRAVFPGGTSATMVLQRWDGAAWQNLYSVAIDLTQHVPAPPPPPDPQADWYRHLVVCADLFAGNVRVRDPAPTTWFSAETWFSRLEASQFEPFVVDLSDWGYREWDLHWSWLVIPTAYLDERRLPHADLMHHPQGGRGGPTELRTSDEDLGVCVLFNEQTYLLSTDPWDHAGFEIPAYTSPCVTDDVEYGYQAPFAMLGRFKFQSMDTWPKTMPVDIMVAGEIWNAVPSSVCGIGVFWRWTGGDSEGELVATMYDVTAFSWIEATFAFNGDDWDGVPVDIGVAWSGNKGYDVGRQDWELRLTVNGQTVDSVVSFGCRVRGCTTITIGSNVAISSVVPNDRRSFVGMFRAAMVFGDALSDDDIRDVWYDTQALDNPSFESPAVRPGAAASWTWDCFQAVGGFAGFNQYRTDLLAWATADEMFGGGWHSPHFYVYEDAVERLAATGFTLADVGKIAWQRDNDTLWVLSSYSPIIWTAMTISTNEDWVADLLSTIAAVFNLGASQYESIIEAFSIWDFSDLQGQPPGTIISPPWLEAFDFIAPCVDTLSPVGGPTGFNSWYDLVIGAVEHPLETDDLGEAWENDPLSTVSDVHWIPGTGVDGILRGQALTFPVVIRPDDTLFAVWSDISSVNVLSLTPGEYATAADLSNMVESVWESEMGLTTGVQWSWWEKNGQSGLTFGYKGDFSLYIAWAGMLGVPSIAKHSRALDLLGMRYGQRGKMRMTNDMLMYPAVGYDDFLFDQWTFLCFRPAWDVQIGDYCLDYDELPAMFGENDGTPDPTVVERFTLIGWFGSTAVWVPSLPTTPTSSLRAKFDSATTYVEHFVDTQWPDNLFS